MQLSTLDGHHVSGAASSFGVHYKACRNDDVGRETFNGASRHAFYIKCRYKCNCGAFFGGRYTCANTKCNCGAFFGRRYTCANTKCDCCAFNEGRYTCANTKYDIGAFFDTQCIVAYEWCGPGSVLVWSCHATDIPSDGQARTSAASIAPNAECGRRAVASVGLSAPTKWFGRGSVLGRSFAVAPETPCSCRSHCPDSIDFDSECFGRTSGHRTFADVA